MSETTKEMPRWSFAWTRWRRGFVFSLAVHYHDGRHQGIRGWDGTVGLGFASFHVGYRSKRNA